MRVKRGRGEVVEALLLKKPEAEGGRGTSNLFKQNPANKLSGGETDTHSGSPSVLTSQPSLEGRSTISYVTDLLCDPGKVTLPL